jgi:hypothetical protein
MFRAHLKLVFRTMAKHRGYTLISIAGLALALTCAFLMLLFITFETSYDRYHENAGRVYRVTSAWSGDRAGESAAVSGDLPLDGQFPEVEKRPAYSPIPGKKKRSSPGTKDRSSRSDFFSPTRRSSTSSLSISSGAIPRPHWPVPRTSSSANPWP